MTTLNGGMSEGSVRGCYDSTPQEVDVHRLTIICTSLLRSYPALLIAKIRPTQQTYSQKNAVAVSLATQGNQVFDPSSVLEGHSKTGFPQYITPVITPTLTLLQKWVGKTVSYRIFTTVQSTVGVKLYAPIAYQSVSVSGHLVKLFSTFRNKI